MRRPVDLADPGELLPHGCTVAACKDGCAHGDAERCWCHELYGSKQFWGCEWFEEWRALARRAHEAGHVLVVYYFDGHLEEHGAKESLHFHAGLGDVLAEAAMAAQKRKDEGGKPVSRMERDNLLRAANNKDVKTDIAKLDIQAALFASIQDSSDDE